MPTGVYPRTAAMKAAQVAKMKAGIKRRQAAGLHFGAPIRRVRLTLTCGFCEREFQRRDRDDRPAVEYCSTRCHMAAECEKRRKVPEDRDLLAWLYWERNMTTVEIASLFKTNHRTVISAMDRLDVPRRRVGKSRHETCLIEGCNQPVFKIQHKGNGSWYGRRCYPHWREHRTAVAKRYWQEVERPRREARRLWDKSENKAKARFTTAKTAAGQQSSASAAEKTESVSVGKSTGQRAVPSKMSFSDCSTSAA